MHTGRLPRGVFINLGVVTGTPAQQETPPAPLHRLPVPNLAKDPLSVKFNDSAA